MSPFLVGSCYLAFSLGNRMTITSASNLRGGMINGDSPSNRTAIIPDDSVNDRVDPRSVDPNNTLFGTGTDDDASTLSGTTTSSGAAATATATGGTEGSAFFLAAIPETPALPADSDRATVRATATAGSILTSKTAAATRLVGTGIVSNQTAPAAIATIPLHASSGTHHAHVYVGSPPQRQTLIIDTGSRLMAFPCFPCNNCGQHVSNHFDPRISTTDRTPKCGNCLLEGVSRCSEFSEKCVISQKYTEGSSWNAYEVEDLVFLGSTDDDELETFLRKLAVPYPFGCQTSETGLFRKQFADGILGLAIHDTSLVSVLRKTGAISRNAFGLCLTRNGGTLSLGGIGNPVRHKEPMQFSPIAREHGWFALDVWEVRLGETCIACGKPSLALQSFVGGKGTILDSGTTDTYLPLAVSDRFEDVWKEYTRHDFAQRRRKYTWKDYLNLPELSFLFANNVTLTVSPSSYMEGVPEYPHWTGKVELVNRIYLDEPEGAVLGANTMFGHEMLFDVEGHRVGIAKADCDWPIPSLG